MRAPFRSLSLAVLLAARAANAGLVEEIVEAILGATTCGGCHGLLTPLKAVAFFGDKPVVDTFVAVCSALDLIGVIDKDVCEGGVRTQGPILAEVLRNINPLGKTAKKLCDALLGLCDTPDVTPYTVTFPKPRPANPTKFVSTGKAPFQVLHFSDVHIDRNYTVGADATCSKPICCRNYADQTGPVQTPAGPMGMRNCDTTTAFAANLYRQITPNNKFSIFTGDVIEATVWLADKGNIQHDLNRFTTEISTLPGTVVYPSLGNHDTAPTNALARSTTTETSQQWVYDILAAGWQPVIGATAAQQVKHESGSYALVVPGTKLRLISLNTVWWYKLNFWLYDSDDFQPNPNGFLTFLVNQLQAAEDAGERAWIIGHIPPGGRQDVLHDQSNYFHQVVARYSHVIAATFFGHTHKDEFLVGYSDYNNISAETAIATALINGAITPRSSNPVYKVYDIDPDTYEVMDIKVYNTDINDPKFQTSPTWTLSYSVRQLYSKYVPLKATDSLSPSFWHKLTEVFATNDEAFNAYLSRQNHGVDPESCDASCKKETICDMRAFRAENLCTRGLEINLKRDVVSGRQVLKEHDKEVCAGVGLGHILKAASKTLTPEQWEDLRVQLHKAIPEAS